jgi:hypothetical protein
VEPEAVAEQVRPLERAAEAQEVEVEAVLLPEPEQAEPHVEQVPQPPGA